MPRFPTRAGPARGPHSQFQDSSPYGAAERVEYALYYDLDPEFGPYLKSLREGRGLSLRVAAGHLGVPFSYIQRIETRGRVAKPDLAFLEKLAALYGVPASEMEAKAGVRREPLADPERLVNDQFKALAMHPNWRPPGMTEEWLESFSPKQKRQIIYMMRQLGAQLAKNTTPDKVLAQAGLLGGGGS